MLLELLLLSLSLLLLADFLATKRIQRRLQNMPMISNIPFIGGMLVMASFQPDNLHLKFEEFVRLYGKNFCTRIFGTLMVVTADGRHVDEVLSSHKHIRKHLLYYLLRPWLGDGLLLSHGSKWQAMRKIVTPTFHFKILEQFVEVFDRQSSILVDKLQQYADGGAVIDIYPFMGLLTLDNITETAMGVQFHAQQDSKSAMVQAVRDVTNIVATRFVRPHLAFPSIFRLLTPALHKKQHDGIKTMHDFTEKIIEERRSTLKETDQTVHISDGEDIGMKPRLALLDVLLNSKMDGMSLSDEQIRHEVNTFVFEGHDTTTSATSFCLYLISRHPESQQKLFEEIQSHFGDDLTRPVTYRDLQNLNFLNCVVKESLRMYPPIPAIGRWLKEDLKLEDVTLPAGTNLIILLWQLLRDPDVFPEPERFLPERHLDHNTRANAFSNIPFSAGPRNCIGQRFALLEIKTVVVKMLRSYQLIERGEPVQPSIKIVLRSKTGVNFAIKSRAYANVI